VLQHIVAFYIVQVCVLCVSVLCVSVCGMNTYMHAEWLDAHTAHSPHTPISAPPPSPHTLACRSTAPQTDTVSKSLTDPQHCAHESVSIDGFAVSDCQCACACVCVGLHVRVCVGLCAFVDEHVPCWYFGARVRTPACLHVCAGLNMFCSRACDSVGVCRIEASFIACVYVCVCVCMYVCVCVFSLPCVCSCTRMSLCASDCVICSCVCVGRLACVSQQRVCVCVCVCVEAR
jgi:hypothetical protein